MASAMSSWWQFVSKGVWASPKNTFGVRVVKTINLSVTAFFDRDLQTQAANLTFNTLLALVPALALIFAIGSGFGLHDLLKEQLFRYFPAQREAIQTTLQFVDSYLSQSTEGVFVGVGIIVLLYTLISLLYSIEYSFNFIWGIKKERTLYQKFTDYMAICLLIPILIILASGVSLFISTVFQADVHIPFLTPVVNVFLDLFPLLLIWLAFSLSFLLIPNTKVKFKYAAVAGAVSAIGFQILELLFLNGQIYVTKYNAIYGSFAFLPLLLVWMQFSWVILLGGATLTYSMQNVFAYNYMADSSNVSNNYMRKVAVVLGAIIVGRFARDEAPLTCNEMALRFNLPMRLVTSLVDRLHSIGMVSYVSLDHDRIGIAPAHEISRMSAGSLLRALDSFGDSGFIPHFDSSYADISQMVDSWENSEWTEADSVLLKDIPVNPPAPPSQVT